MMDQKIRIRIADREHELKVKSPEEEERMAGSRFQQKLCEVIADAVLDL